MYGKCNISLLLFTKPNMLKVLHSDVSLLIPGPNSVRCCTLSLVLVSHLPALTYVSQSLCNVVEGARRVEGEGEPASYSTL